MSTEELSSTELLGRLWNFVHGRVALSRLPAFLEEHGNLLDGALPEETAAWLRRAAEGQSDPLAVRRGLGQAIARYEMDCACPRFPSSAITGRTWLPLPPLVDSAFAFVEHHIETSLTLIAKDAWYTRYWRDSGGDEFHLRPGHYYCCRLCSASVLTVLNETNLEYLVLSLSVRELSQSTPQKLRERFAADFALTPVGADSPKP